MEAYQTAYEALNQQQRQAVTTTEGPVLVIAGPGTGKTQLLAVRIAYLIREGLADPSQILCLTFTNKAATNMRERLISFAGFEAQAATIKTFHAFASEIMQHYPEAFWNGASLQAISDPKAHEIVEEILAGLPHGNPLSLSFSGQYTQTKAVLRALNLAKEAGLTPERLRAIIEFNLAYINEVEEEVIAAFDRRLSIAVLDELFEQIAQLPDTGVAEAMQPLMPFKDVLMSRLHFCIQLDTANGKTTNTSKLKSELIKSINGQKKLWSERNRNEWWLALSDVYAQYRQRLHAAGYYDYADMLVEVITKLETDHALLAEVQERFAYVHVDEFQDSNAAQLRLAHLLADHYVAEGNPNLLVVGDDDQTIFKFNGAELNNMLNFERFYPKVQKITLVQNYRSHQSVLDTAARIISHAQDRLVLRDPTIKKDLIASGGAPQGTIHHLRYDSCEQQYNDIADRVRASFQEGGTVAVIARKHESLEQLAGLLTTRGVPVRYERQQDLLDQEPIQTLLRMARIVDGLRSGDRAGVSADLADLVTHPMFSFDPLLLWRLASENRYTKDWMTVLAQHQDEAIKQLANWLLWAAQEAQVQPLAVMLEHLLGLRASELYASPFISHYTDTEGLTDSLMKTISAIARIRSLAYEYGSAAAVNLHDFVQYLTIHETNHIPLSDTSVFASSAKAVELLSVHKAKGLEFDTVFVIDAIESEWQPRRGGRKPPMNLPLQPNGDDQDDYARLLYVAATRAKSNLVFSSYRFDAGGEAVLATPLLTDACQEEEIAAPATTDTISILIESLRYPELSVVSERELLQGILQNFNLSVTSLINFLDVTKGGPRYFVERNLLRLPERKTESLSFGTAIHAALHRAQLLVNKQHFDLSTVLETFSASLQREQIDPFELQRLTGRGSELLKSLLHPDGPLKLTPGSQPELKLDEVLLGDGIRLSGAFDRIDMTDAGTCIIDYKTGGSLSSFTSRDEQKRHKAWQHKLQLVFYVILARQSGRFDQRKPIEGKMIYLESDSPRSFELGYTPSEAEIDATIRLIRVVWQKIQSYELPDIRSYPVNMDGVEQFIADLLV